MNGSRVVCENDERNPEIGRKVRGVYLSFSPNDDVRTLNLTASCSNVILISSLYVALYLRLRITMVFCFGRADQGVKRD